MRPVLDFCNFRQIGIGMLGLLSLAAFASDRATDPPQARTTPKHEGSSFELENSAIGARRAVAYGLLGVIAISDRLHQAAVPLEEPFRLLLNGGSILDRRNIRLTSEPKATRMQPGPNASKLAALFDLAEARKMVARQGRCAERFALSGR